MYFVPYFTESRTYDSKVAAYVYHEGHEGSVDTGYGRATN